MQEVRDQINDGIKLQRQLELIEAIDRLGLSSLFHEEIYRVLSVLSLNNCKEVILCGLRSTAICFQLLRRFGFQISEGIFDDFMDGDHNAFLPTLSDDVIGLLSLYNASYMAFPGENKMESARSFAVKHMNRENMQEILPGSIESAIGHALDLPLHRRMPWMEARMYIDMYELEDDMSPPLLHLAKIHFNKVQSIHQKELKHAGSWWRRLDLGKTINFSRDRLMECFFYVVGIVHHPDYGFCREKLTQVGRSGHRPGRSVQIKEDRPEHRPGCKTGRLKIGLIVQADLTIILADHFKSEKNHPDNSPGYELAEIYRPEVT
ncbi:(-)-alpha-terpineol synthase [Dendrobium catenatum]|uniref:(-)-alpha-terpineol synthase n=1 Tax=Dendrobium catenatum TaxID=906689 RepID=A0A2I0W2T3_9ASPA|nr:(-)-alpha-terpineol synthase [Dendrobium catenatum]